MTTHLNLPQHRRQADIAIDETSHLIAYTSTTKWTRIIGDGGGTSDG